MYLYKMVDFTLNYLCQNWIALPLYLHLLLKEIEELKQHKQTQEKRKDNEFNNKMTETMRYKILNI